MSVIYCAGTHTSANYIGQLNPLLTPAFGATLYEGSLNLWAYEPVAFPKPRTDGPWWFVPVVLREKAVGIAARTPETDPHRFIEVYAHKKIAEALKLSPGDLVAIRLMPGTLLKD